MLVLNYQRILVKDIGKIGEKATDGLSQKFHLMHFSNKKSNTKGYKLDAPIGNKYIVEKLLDGLKKILFRYNIFNTLFGSLHKVMGDGDNITKSTLDP